MENKLKKRKPLDIDQIENPFEKDILLFLRKKGTCVYGDIMKELKISASRGQEAIYSLLTKGLVRHKNKSSRIELNVELKS